MYINCFSLGIKTMSSLTISNRRLNNAGYPVQDRFAFDFGKTVTIGSQEDERPDI
jgi:hypothetical protein